MHVWLTAFIADVRKVDDFFREKLAELINEFVEMQEKCLDKTRGMLYVKEQTEFSDEVEAWAISSKILGEYSVNVDGAPSVRSLLFGEK